MFFVICFSAGLTERVQSFGTSITDLSLAATTATTNLHRAAEQFTRLIAHLEQQRTATSLLLDRSSVLKQLHETVAMLRQLASGLDAAKTEVSKRQTRLKIPTTSHLTSDAPVSQCLHERW